MKLGECKFGMVLYHTKTKEYKKMIGLVDLDNEIFILVLSADKEQPATKWKPELCRALIVSEFSGTKDEEGFNPMDLVVEPPRDPLVEERKI